MGCVLQAPTTSPNFPSLSFSRATTSVMTSWGFTCPPLLVLCSAPLNREKLGVWIVLKVTKTAGKSWVLLSDTYTLAYGARGLDSAGRWLNPGPQLVLGAPPNRGPCAWTWLISRSQSVVRRMGVGYSWYSPCFLNSTLSAIRGKWSMYVNWEPREGPESTQTQTESENGLVSFTISEQYLTLHAINQKGLIQISGANHGCKLGRKSH